MRGAAATPERVYTAFFAFFCCACAVIGVLLSVVVFILIHTVSAFAANNGEYDNVDPAIRSWFEAVKSPNGVPCCSIADGHYTTWRSGKDGGYEVPIDGVWTPVPSDVVIRNAHNPTGDAVIWYSKYSDRVYIRCFALGEES